MFVSGSKQSDCIWLIRPNLSSISSYILCFGKVMITFWKAFLARPSILPLPEWLARKSVRNITAFFVGKLA